MELPIMLEMLILSVLAFTDIIVLIHKLHVYPVITLVKYVLVPTQPIVCFVMHPLIGH